MINPRPLVDLHGGVVPRRGDFARCGAGGFVEVRGDVVIDGAGEDDQNLAWEGIAPTGPAGPGKGPDIPLQIQIWGWRDGPDIRNRFDDSGCLGICAADVGPVARPGFQGWRCMVRKPRSVRWNGELSEF